MKCIFFMYAVGGEQISGLFIYKLFMSWDFQISKQSHGKFNCINYFMLFWSFHKRNIIIQDNYFPISSVLWKKV